MPGAEQAHLLIHSAGIAGASAVCQALLRHRAEQTRPWPSWSRHSTGGREEENEQEIENLVSC